MHVPPFEVFEERIRRLPPRARLLPVDLLTDDFRVAREGPVDVYFMPTEQPSAARVLIVGITPGWAQMELAYRALRDDLNAGVSVPTARLRAHGACAFAGPMRTNLVRMLDELGLPQLLHIRAADALFGERSDLLCATSVLRHPVFVHGKNFTGHDAVVERSAFFSSTLTDIFVPRLRSLAPALIVPLGDFVTNVLRELVRLDVVDEQRCLFRFPHPSGANGHKWARFAEVRDELRAKAARVLG